MAVPDSSIAGEGVDGVAFEVPATDGIIEAALASNSLRESYQRYIQTKTLRSALMRRENNLVETRPKLPRLLRQVWIKLFGRRTLKRQVFRLHAIS